MPMNLLAQSPQKPGQTSKTLSRMPMNLLALFVEQNLFVALQKTWGEELLFLKDGKNNFVHVAF